MVMPQNHFGYTVLKEYSGSFQDIKSHNSNVETLVPHFPMELYIVCTLDLRNAVYILYLCF